MFKIGDKAKGFKFDGDKYSSLGYAEDMDNAVGVVGVVTHVGDNSYSVKFGEEDFWGYPNDLRHLGKVEEEVIPSFTVGDRVKFKKSSIDSGMIDATEDDVFVVESCHKEHWGDLVKLFGMISTVNVNHLEYVKESAMNNTEEQEIKWEVGQEVWDVRYGKGIVDTLLAIPCQYPIGVVFADGGTASYTSKGLNRCTDVYRSLFFSEPKIEAEKFPPKKLFVPTLEKGDVVIVKWRGGTVQMLVLEEETEAQIKGDLGQVWDKTSDAKFYKLGEEIKFN